jgi:hypothetical protein
MSDIYSSSRYASATMDFISVNDSNTVTPVLFYNFDDVYNTKYSVHYYAKGQRLDQLSFMYYDRPDLWWAIVEYNPEVKDFFNITPGTPLRIPNV